MFDYKKNEEFNVLILVSEIFKTNSIFLVSTNPLFTERKAFLKWDHYFSSYKDPSKQLKGKSPEASELLSLQRLADCCGGARNDDFRVEDS